MNLSERLSREILPSVEKPSRYLGNELNSVHKAEAEVRIALAFPDLYDLGLGNLGLHILYAILNRLPWCWAERVYAPAQDLETALRVRGLPLFAVESRDSLDSFDAIGITLQSELTWTNILNMLDLGGLPLRTKDRRPTDPITLAGGPAVFNPEPLAPFIDAFVIGDGEEVIVEIAQVLRATKDREARLDALAKLDGVYVPARYSMEVLENGAVRPPLGAPKIRKRTVARLNGADFPTNYIVPYTEQVHDRVSLEVLRGCTQGCRFCQAGMTTRPVRERTIDEVDTLLQRTLEATGYEEVSLVSLSTCDHSQVRGLVERVVERTRDQKVAVGLPSLRLDSFSVELADMVADTRRTGLTFAPEAASPRLRALINKWIPDEDLIRMSSDAFAKGWEHVKLYFMIGLPTEREEDIDAIADLCRRTLLAGKEHTRFPNIHTGVSTFVPKPFTPFQWSRQIGLEETDQKQIRLLGHFRTMKGVKFGRHNSRETFLEGLLSRSDRRAGDLLEGAWRNGARFDAWSEHLNWDAWQAAIAETSFDTEDALRERDVTERLPWDHIDIHIPKSWFAADYARAVMLQHAPDCRAKKCHQCGVIDVHRELCASMLRRSIEGRKVEKDWTRQSPPMAPDPLPVQRIRVRIGRSGDVRLLSHLETAATWLRALRRAGAALSWSKGFHPHPRVNFSGALPVGEESVDEYMDVVVHTRIAPAELVARLGAVLPEGFHAFEAGEVPLNADALMGKVGATDCVIHTTESIEVLQERVSALLARPDIRVRRHSKRGEIEVDVRPMIREMVVREDGAVRVALRDVDGKPGKGREMVTLLGLDPVQTRVVRTASWIVEDAVLRSPRADWLSEAHVAAVAATAE